MEVPGVSIEVPPACTGDLTTPMEVARVKARIKAGVMLAPTLWKLARPPKTDPPLPWKLPR